MTLGRFILLFPLVLALAAPAREAEVLLLDGHRLRGEFAPAGPDTFQLTREGTATAIALTNVARLTFAPATETMPPSGTSGAPAGPVATGAGWTGSAIGTETAGRFEFGPRTVRVEGAGTGLRGNADSCWFVHQTVGASIDLVARLLGQEAGGSNHVAGVMIRDNLGGATAYALLAVHAGGGLSFQHRAIPSGPTLRETNRLVTLPRWLKLARDGSTVRGYASGDGVQWVPVGEAALNLGQRARAGFTVASGSESAPHGATFELISLGGGGAASEGGLYPRVLTRGGSWLVAPVESADESAVRLGGAFSGVSLSMVNVARILFRPEPSGTNAPAAGRAGALLASGDFVEGDLRRLTNGVVVVHSLLFGPRRLRAGTDVVVVQVGEAASEPALFAVATANGSEVRAQALEFAGDRVRLTAPSLGTIEVGLNELAGIQRIEEAGP